MPIWFLLIIVLALYNLIVCYFAFMTRKWIFFDKSPIFNKIYIITFILFANIFIFIFRYDYAAVRAVGSYWMAVLYILFITVPILHIIVSGIRFTKLKSFRVEKWAGWLMLLMIIVIMGYGSYNAYNPVVRTYEVSIDQDSEQNQKLNIVMAADMHFGLLSGKNHAARMVEEINKLQPDLVLFPGDIVDDSVHEYVRQGMVDIIANIESTYGVYASLGNHDKGDIPELIEILEKSNMNVLYDETIEIADSVTLVGRKDKTEKDRLSLSELLKDADQSKPVILLDHQPYELAIAEEQGVDLLVSGHTHRGQLAPFQLITKSIYENDWGYIQNGELHSVVTSGFGFWGPPIRTNSRSEIVQIQLNY